MERIRRLLKNRGARKTPVPVYLCYLAIVALLLTSASFAKFATTTEATDTARVAGFAASVSFTDVTDPLELDDKNALSVDYDFVVYNVADPTFSGSFISEVAQKYDVTIVLPKKLDTGVTMKIDGNTADDVSSDGLTYTFLNVGVFEAHEAAVAADHTHKLNFSCETSGITADDTLTDIKIRVHVEQID